MYEEGDYVILDPQVKTETDSNDLAYSDNQRWVSLTFRHAEGSSLSEIELHP